MGRYTLNSIVSKYAFLLFGLLLVACQSKLDEIGQEHALEVKKWQELARYAGNELKPLGLTITAGVQINHSDKKISFSLINVQLNRTSNNTEVDLLSPKFAEKFACNSECQNLGLYDASFKTQKTQLAGFFFEEEGRFFEFYGKLTRLNELLAFYRASSPEILNKYLALMLNRKMTFNSLSTFMQYLESHINEENLLAYSQSGFISPVQDRLSPGFVEDVMVNIPSVSIDNTPLESPYAETEENWISPEKNWAKVGDAATSPDLHWVTSTPTPDELMSTISLDNIPTADTINANWQHAKEYKIQVGAIVCSYSDNNFGLVKEIHANTATLDVLAQARLFVDGMNLYPPAGYLFSAANDFDFVKSSSNKNYPLSDIAACNLTQLTRGQT